MTETKQGKATRVQGNIGVPIGTVVLVVCFFLPWVRPSNISAAVMVVDATRANATALYAMGVTANHPQAVSRVLLMIPLLAVSTLLLELSAPAGHSARVIARISILAGGGTLCVFFVAVGLQAGPKLLYGFWGSLSGALFITVGGLFNVFRGE